MDKGHTIKILDKGYVKLVDWMGDDSTTIEAARMSTGKGFFGWHWEKDTYANVICMTCHTQHLAETLPMDDGIGFERLICTTCWKVGVHDIRQPMLGDIKPKLLGKAGEPRDLNLLEFLYMNRHMTPFEMGELCIEVKAPIFVFREWHRHRTQAYNEFSARYSQMPNEHYVPEPDRIQKQSTTNKQGSEGSFEAEDARAISHELSHEQADIYGRYDRLVRAGVAKEVARVNTPVSRYSKMRAKTDVRNWLAFLALRMEKSAQWEIRQYANAVASIIQAIWPRTFELFLEHDLLAVRFSRKEMRLLQMVVTALGDRMTDKTRELSYDVGMSEKQVKAFLAKVTTDKETDYADVLAALKG